VVSQVNATLPAIERVRRFLIANEAFTTTNGQLTPTLKIKRHIVRAVYRDALDGLYESRSAAA
jgi:long-chain acyl-CoA synthetase